MKQFLLFALSCFAVGCAANSSDNSVNHEHHAHDEHHEHHGSHQEQAEKPAIFEVTGTVVDINDQPVANAFVLQGGRPETIVLTQEDGSFSMMFEQPLLGLPSIVATKPGFRASGNDTVTQGQAIKIRIQAVEGPDNEDYVYQDPGDGIDDMKEDCTHCHKTFVAQFLSSKHAKATQNPLLQDLYAGTSRAYTTEESCIAAGGAWQEGKQPGRDDVSLWKCYLGGGVLPDLNPHCGDLGQPVCDSPTLTPDQNPTSFGSCADCHAPGINGKAGGRNLHDAVGISFDKGVHCDTCHKVRDIDLSKPPGVGQRLVMGRPNEQSRTFFEWDPVYYGPLMDVPNPVMGGSYQPKFKEALFCAGCHEQNQEALLPTEELNSERWPNGLPIHSTYSEWESGPYNREATPCQFCHMPSTYGRVNAADTSTLANQSAAQGFLRSPDDIRQHTFRGPLMGSPRLIDEALYVSIKSQVESMQLRATVSVTNIGCGHAVPTGEPMRSLVLVVEASGTSCDEIIPNGGMTVHDIGGAIASGKVGEEVTLTGTTLTWPAVGGLARQGQVIRVVRPTGTFDTSASLEYFPSPASSPENRGLEIFSPIGSARVESVTEHELSLSTEISIQAGDMIYLGDPWSPEPVDGQNALHLAGKAGYTFAKVLLDSEGNRHVPHYAAVDIASDNRIGPGASARTTHTFSLPPGCTNGEVRAWVFYRPIPLKMAALRGWNATDYLIAEGRDSF